MPLPDDARRTGVGAALRRYGRIAAVQTGHGRGWRLHL